MQFRALIDTGHLMGSIFLSTSYVYILLMLGILPRVQARIPLSIGLPGFVQNFKAACDKGRVQERLGGPEVKEGVTGAYRSETCMVSRLQRLN